MTPEGTHSSEELLEAEENSAAPSSSTSGTVQIRIRGVAEINSNEAEADASPSPLTKRKLPSWMALKSPQQNNVCGKKRKTVPIDIQTTTASSSADYQPQPQSSATPSTPATSLPEEAEPCLSSNGQPQSSAIPSTSATSFPEEAEPSPSTNVQSSEVDANHGDAQVKEEPGVNNEATASGCQSDEPSCSTTPLIKTEPNASSEDSATVGQITPTSPKDIKPAVKVEKTEATSSTSRVSCKFGIRCYRQNPVHRREEAHPGDLDYKRPDFPAPPDGTPECPFGDLCYRRNPVHFQQYSHPPSTDFAKNYKDFQMRLRQRRPQPVPNPNSSYSDLSEDDDYDLADPFLNDDSEDDFLPDDADDFDDDDDFF